MPASYESEISVADKVEELIELMGLAAFREKLTGELSTGSRRIVDLACILAQEPSVLMLDEPSGGVAQKETEALAPLLLRVRDKTGCSILVIEHDMPLLRTICDRMVALELGGVIAEGTPDGSPRAPEGDRELPRHRRHRHQSIRRRGRVEEEAGGQEEGSGAQARRYFDTVRLTRASAAERYGWRVPSDGPDHTSTAITNLPSSP